MSKITETKKRLARAIAKELTSDISMDLNLIRMRNKITSILVNKLSHKDLDLIILNMIIKQQN
tara:strand:+ start:363 stop:551 length:189 start_codon:yes stop_codon:yes gene_type:complete